MLSEILLETLSFLDRSSLEACQLVNRSYLKTITKSNAALALRPMDLLYVHCIRDSDEDGTVDQFLRRASEGHDAVGLKIGTDWSHLQAVAAETVARTRNMCISNVYLWCVECASQLIALWRYAFDDRMPCRAVELSMAVYCSLKSDANLQQLFQSFASSKLGVRCYKFPVYAWNDRDGAQFDALWTAWDRPTAQFVALAVHGSAAMSYVLEQLLHESGHESPHYTVDVYSPEVLLMVESYVQASY